MTRYVPALTDGDDEYPLAGDVIDVEPVRPPWPGWERLGIGLGRVWHYGGVIALITLRCSARLAYGLPWVAGRSLVALIRRFR